MDPEFLKNWCWEEDSPKSGDQETPETTDSKDDPPTGARTEAERVGLHTLKVNGVERKVTDEELKELASKGLGADEKFREASEVRKENEKFRAMQADLQAAKKGDLNAIKRLGTYEEYLGITQEQADAVVAELQQQQTEDQEGQGDGPPQPPRLDQMPPEVQQAVYEANQRKVQGTLREIAKEVSQAVDRDEVLGYVLDGNPKQKQRVSEQALGILRRLCVDERRPYGSETLKAAVQEVRQWAEDIGILNSSGDEAAASGPSSALGRSPASMTSNAIRRAKEPPNRLEKGQILNTEDYSQNVLDRMRHMTVGKAKSEGEDFIPS